MSTLYFIRHGQASFGQSNYDVLSETGTYQARLLAEHLYKLDIRFDAVYIGPQQRHQQTAEALIDRYKTEDTGRFAIKALAELAEYDFGSVLKTLIPVLSAENKRFNDDVARMFDNHRAFQRVFETAALRWVKGEYPPGELMPWGDFTARVNRGLHTIMKEDGKKKTVAVFTSGGPVAVAAQKALKLSDEMTMRLNWQIVNCSVSRFKCTGENIMLATFNEYPWLEQAEVNGLVTYR